MVQKEVANLQTQLSTAVTERNKSSAAAIELQKAHARVQGELTVASRQICDLKCQIKDSERR